MSRIGHGYGSECHLLRWMGRHRRQFDGAVLASIGAPNAQIDWLDFGFKPSTGWSDEEVKGVDFLFGEKNDDGLIRAWRRYWPDENAGQPHRIGIHSWDAVGKLRHPNGSSEWLLVEAKAHEKELLGYPTTACQAKGESLTTICRSLRETADFMGVPTEVVESTWLGVGCYQVANRLATLNFLLNGAKPPQPARLVFVYFMRDSHSNWRCPRSAVEWRRLAAGLSAKMGIPHTHRLSDRIHYVYLDVSPTPRKGQSA